ncbi:TA system VapC family ribonuclease toxin [Micropruina sp.]|uniref:TA system VapC family ribonuclease toxin n=1 Tax=Micropruina sp. TaxID=2737536 RepID=UPI0039E52BF4
MRALLDINMLIALFDEDHIHHLTARDWLLANAEHGWASCPITENGFVRILSQPAYPGSVSVGAAMELLAGARVSPTHEFWPADISVLDAVTRTRVHGPRQLTDLYLLALAVHHRGRFVTLDARIPPDAVPGATTDDLVVLGRGTPSR